MNNQLKTEKQTTKRQLSNGRPGLYKHIIDKFNPLISSIVILFLFSQVGKLKDVEKKSVF